MKDTVIQIENLSKKDVLRHQAGGSRRYVAMRDVLTNKAAYRFRPRQNATNTAGWTFQREQTFDL